MDTTVFMFSLFSIKIINKHVITGREMIIYTDEIARPDTLVLYYNAYILYKQ